MNTRESYAHRERLDAAHFDQLADELGEIWWGSTTSAGIKRLRRRARLLDDARSGFENFYVLELGCLEGMNSQYILDERLDLWRDGIDVSPESIQTAAKRRDQHSNAKSIAGSALRNNFDDNAVDAIVGNSVLQDIPLEACLLRILKPGSYLWFSDPNMLDHQIAATKNIKFIGGRLQNVPDETASLRWRLVCALRGLSFREIGGGPFDFLHPAVPNCLKRWVRAFCEFLERVPFIREISGSLIIPASK